MENWQERTEMLLGAEGVRKLRDAHVAVIGVGGCSALEATGPKAARAMICATTSNGTSARNNIDLPVFILSSSPFTVHYGTDSAAQACR